MKCYNARFSARLILLLSLKVVWYNLFNISWVKWSQGSLRANLAKVSKHSQHPVQSTMERQKVLKTSLIVFFVTLCLILFLQNSWQNVGKWINGASMVTRSVKSDQEKLPFPHLSICLNPPYNERAIKENNIGKVYHSSTGWPRLFIRFDRADKARQLTSALNQNKQYVLVTWRIISHCFNVGWNWN